MLRNMMKKMPYFGFLVLFSIYILSIANVNSNPALELNTHHPYPSNWLIKLRQPEWEAYYHRIFGLLAENTMYPEKIDRNMEHKFDGKLYSFDSAQAAVQELVACINDDYTYFCNIAETNKKLQDAEEKNTVEFKKILLKNKKLGYLHIKTFASCFVAEETQTSLQKLRNVDGYILDLRDNNGGSVEEVYKVFSLFCREGKFVTVKGRLNGEDYFEELSLTKNKCRRTTNGYTTEEERNKNLTGKKPVVIITNGKTRSAAEMLAGALRDNGRANIIGSKTYGKGVVQNTWVLANGTSVKIAIARYYLPSGISINGTGITPDMLINQPDENKHSDRELTSAKQELVQLICSHLKVAR
jgi:carboxyl-terminal processing protease